MTLTPRSTVMYSSGVKLRSCKTREVLGDRVGRIWFAEVEGAYAAIMVGRLLIIGFLGPIIINNYQ